MASVTSNRSEIIRELTKLRDSLTFLGPGLHRSTFGLDAVDGIAGTVMEQTVLDQKEPEDSSLAPLSAKYLARKIREGHSDLILVRTGLMLSLENLRGVYTVSRNGIRMVYGTSAEARHRAEWATEGSKNRPERPFYSLNDLSIKYLNLLTDQTFDRNAKNNGCT